MIYVYEILERREFKSGEIEPLKKINERYLWILKCSKLYASMQACMLPISA